MRHLNGRWAMPLAILALTAMGLGLVTATAGYSHFVLALVALTTIAGVGLNVLLGLTGLISFGHAGFYAIGAYASAVLTGAGVGFWLALPAAAALSGLVGVVLAIPAMRVKGPYLAMVTIAFGFIVEHALIEGGSLTGGQNGLVVTGGPSLFGVPFAEGELAILAILGAGAALYGFHRLALSRLGRAMRAVRDADVAAASLGFDPVRVKTLAFAISAALTGLAGAVLPPLMLFIAPSSFPFSQSILFVLAVVVGGAGTVLGPLFGALVTVLLPETLSGLAEYRLLFFGFATLVVLWLVPAGLVGSVARVFPRRTEARATEEADSAGFLAAFLGKRPGEPLIVDGIGIRFGGIRAAEDVSFTAQPGAVTSVIGPNGAGKTTVLNMVSGFYRPGTGAIRLGTRDLTGAPAQAIARAGIARTYQTTRLFGSLGVLDNVSLAFAPGRLWRRAGRDDRMMAAGLLAFTGYTGALDRRADELPHVDRRLVEIARALAGRPRVLLLDEPAAGLTRADTDRLGGLLRRIAACGVAVILVEHDMPLVMGVSDHVLVMDAGRPIASGAPGTIRHDPAVIRAYLGAADTPARPRATPWRGPADAVLSAHGLTVGYGAAPVLAGVSLEVRPGETVALLGANGAGKSTAMRALAGLLRPVEGGIVLEDRAVAGLPAHRIARLGLALVPEGRQVFPELTVVENIRLGAHGRAEPIDPAEIEALLTRFPRLRDRATSRAGLLSGGEQQMLAIARGMMAHPRILLLDEPSLGLAPAMINALYAVVAELRDGGTTILIVDQMAALALTVADRGYVLEQGRVVAAGSAADLAADKGLEAAYLGAA
ncbi:branched-chain amino acid ABC transporter ATP-binding protein/permease [Methylobacterium sp. Leaf112]|uniref:branched-chain amino acid ABC transporter ATP-binding protein/permease n=1 Tax=Methylobacterium sp. Leaf112 TaxID=1736258 RepID=UPI0006FFA79E|nr:branched-chain amino acid ABC transporter ATP-binding protein/permease [Methylobacterium sp. Leaf112]KQP63928.1 ABC transporter [Methylobacterium sp. Leaf112]